MGHTGTWLHGRGCIGTVMEFDFAFLFFSPIGFDLFGVSSLSWRDRNGIGVCSIFRGWGGLGWTWDSERGTKQTGMTGYDKPQSTCCT